MAWPREAIRFCGIRAPVHAERDGVHRAAHAVIHVLDDRGEILLEVDGVIQGAILGVDLLLLRDQLLLHRRRKNLIGVLLSMNL